MAVTQRDTKRSDFNPRSPWGERPADMLTGQMDRCVFQSTLPVGGATTSPSDFRRRFIFQSTLPVGGATSSKLCADPCARISIHAPRGGSDSQRGHGIGVPVPISIHTPRRGSDTSKVEPLPMVFVFQSTLPTGGATRPAAVLLRNQPISIHAPRGGERPYIRTEWSIPGGFQSTLPAGGSDLTFAPSGVSPADFNPLSPRGGATQDGGYYYQQYIFQSTLPAGGATFCFRASRSAFYISIHAPRGGSDKFAKFKRFGKLSFQSTLPAGGATCLKLHRCLPRMKNFNPRSPRGERRLFATRRHMLQ